MGGASTGGSDTSDEKNKILIQHNLKKIIKLKMMEQLRKKMFLKKL